MNFKGAFHAFMSKNKNLAKVANLSYQISSFKSSFMFVCTPSNLVLQASTGGIFEGRKRSA